jgi:uncharacterized protein
MNAKTFVTLVLGMIAMRWEAWTADQPPLKERIAAAAGAVKDPVQPAAPRRVLMLSLAEGFKHGVMPTVAEAYRALSEHTGVFTFEDTKDKGVINAERLAQVDTLILNNTSLLKLDETQRAALLGYVRGGGGLVGIHAATDAFSDWPEGAALLGGIFDGHPWNAPGTWRIIPEEPDHPLNRGFGGEGFSLRDEIYQFKAPYDRANLRVLLKLDWSDESNHKVNKNDIKRTDEDFAISWIRREGEGRVFYTSLGHNDDVFTHAGVLQHLLDGLQYATGDRKVDDAPSKR